MEEKHPKHSSINDNTYRIFSNDLNSQGTVFGGRIMEILDRIALVIAERHSQRTCVTVSVDAMHFLAPAGHGDNLIFKGSINRAWNSSMEIGVKVLAEHKDVSKKTHILSAYFTFVGLDDHKKPTKVPKVSPETTDEKRRFQEAGIRKSARAKHQAEIEKLRRR